MLPFNELHQQFNNKQQTYLPERISNCRVCIFSKFVPVSQTKFVPFVHNKNIVKTRSVLPTKDLNAEILLGGFNNHFVHIE